MKLCLKYYWFVFFPDTVYSSISHISYELIPNVGTNILFPVKRDIGISYRRLLLHDTMLQESLANANVKRATAVHI